MEPLGQLPRHAVPQQLRRHDAGRQVPRRGHLGGADRGRRLVGTAVRRLDDERLQWPDAHDRRERRSCGVLRCLRRRRQRHDRPERARRRAALQQREPWRHRRALRSRLPGGDRPAGDLLERPHVLRAGRNPVRQADAEPRRPHRALGALRDDRREHLHVPVGIRAAPQRRLRRIRRRQAQGVGVLGPLLRPGPQQHDQLRGHAHRLDHRGAGIRQLAQQVRHLPHTRRPVGAGRVLLADDADARTPTICSSPMRSISATT